MGLEVVPNDEPLQLQPLANDLQHHWCYKQTLPSIQADKLCL